jgi:hypothetical protein
MNIYIDGIAEVDYEDWDDDDWYDDDDATLMTLTEINND